MRDFIRKETVIIDETRSEIGRKLETPLRKCASIAAVTGLGGEQEHGSALLHTGFDEGVRSVLTTSKAIIPSSEKSAPAGCSVDVPLHNKLALKVRTHFDAMEVSIADSPREDEILIALCVTTGGRPFPRVGGLLLPDIKGEDGVV